MFELKREIINISRLGDGTDFELSIYNESTNEGMLRGTHCQKSPLTYLTEYDDDTTIIPRSTTVLARRLPASRPGKGGAARYVSGRAPVKALGGARGEAAKGSAQQAGKAADLSAAQTEEERMKAIMGLEAQNWEQEKQQMATQQKVFYGKPNTLKPNNVPEGEPPHGYVCYRCGQKGMLSSSFTRHGFLLIVFIGHWIQACPTNNDPNFKGPIKIKRTTGIPKSFLKQVEKPAGLDASDMSELQGVMVDADGNFVIAHSDEKTWKQFQEKQKQAEEAQKAATTDKELRARGIECPIDKRMFVEPMKTPCCGRTYCGDCITNALIENDLVCPGCSTDGVLLDNLVEDTEAKEKVKAYEAEKSQQKKEASKSPTLSAAASPVKAQLNGTPPKLPKSPRKDGSKSPADSTTDGTTTSKKRSADATNAGELDTVSDAPAMKRQKSNDSSRANPSSAKSAEPPSNEGEASQPLSLNSFMPPDFNNLSQNNNGVFPQMSFPMPNSMPFMPPMPGMPGMPGMPNMMNGMMNPMMMSNMMNGMGGMGGMGPNGFNSNNFNPNNFNPMNMNMNMNMNGGMNGMNGMNNGIPWNNNNSNNQRSQNIPTGPSAHQNNMGNNFMANKFSNQQRSHSQAFNPNQGGTMGGQEDSPYMRQPVNPHRHQNRQRRTMRPSDYREL